MTDTVEIDRLNWRNFKFIFDKATTYITKRNLRESCRVWNKLHNDNKISENREFESESYDRSNLERNNRKKYEVYATILTSSSVLLEKFLEFWVFFPTVFESPNHIQVILPLSSSSLFYMSFLHFPRFRRIWNLCLFTFSFLQINLKRFRLQTKSVSNWFW